LPGFEAVRPAIYDSTPRKTRRQPDEVRQTLELKRLRTAAASLMRLER
jgi:hypothetical protein